MTLDQTMDFWLKMKVVNGCWEWQRSLMSVGYGQVWVPAWKKMTGAHRMAWMLSHGPIADGLQVLHRCDNRLCCRPDHLFLGTQMDNMHDAKAKGRSALGDRHGMRKITSETAVEIRRLREGGMKLQEIGQMFGLASGQVSRIAKGERWASA